MERLKSPFHPRITPLHVDGKTKMPGLSTKTGCFRGWPRLNGSCVRESGSKCLGWTAQDTRVTQKGVFLRYASDCSHAGNAELRVFALLACPPCRRSSILRRRSLKMAPTCDTIRTQRPFCVAGMPTKCRRSGQQSVAGMPTKCRRPPNKRGPATLFTLTGKVGLARPQTTTASP